MRVLQLGKFYPLKGGVEKVMYDLMVGLSAKGIDCDMMCAAMVRQPGSTHQINAHARLMTFRSWMKWAATMLAPSMIWRLRRVANQYDIIHVHHPDPMAGLALWLSGYKGRVILHWHSDIVQQKYGLKMYLPLQNWLIRRAEKIIGTTPVYLRESPHLQHVQDKTVCVPIGIEPIPEVSEQQIVAFRQQYPGKKIVFSLGRMVPYKGHEYLVEAAQYLGDDVVILIGGTGPLRGMLEQKIASLGLQDKVKLVGRISDEELPLYYHGCCLYCTSSVQKTEAFGIVQIEAMSCGKPLIATTIPESGVSWVNKHGTSGLNVPPRDARALASAILEIFANRENYLKLSEGSLRRFQETFRIETMVEKVMQVYNVI